MINVADSIVSLCLVSVFVMMNKKMAWTVYVNTWLTDTCVLSTLMCFKQHFVNLSSDIVDVATVVTLSML